ncbi:GIY-YIG nuclease family protein [Tolypothrix sp. VBCCA 56010]|uniref:GIY-YIG nuclease family protein n=1 Tax=Tolypothrix sp. VBCCA 56010 TaxID=3137731 RepID=UPI003D7C5395
MTATAGYIYLIQAGETDLYKIGLTTRQPEERLRELNGKQSPYPLTLTHYIHVGDVNEVERYLHEECKEYHHHNEWFKIPAELIPELIGLMDKCQVQVQPEETVYQSYSGSTSNDSLPSAIGVILTVVVVFLGLVQCSKMANPKYADCISNQGGSACNRLLAK